MKLLLSALLITLFSSPVARADTLRYTIGSISFELPSKATPSKSEGNTFLFDNVGVSSGASSYSEMAGFGYYSGRYEFGVGNNLEIADGSIVIAPSSAYEALFTSGELFSGQVSDATLLTGTFTGFGGSSTTTDTLVVTSVLTPEPSSIALLSTGLLGLVSTSRKRLAWYR